MTGVQTCALPISQFTKGIAKGLGIKEGIISPTFVIRRDYKGKKPGLLHYDFYRLNTPDEELMESLKEGVNKDNVTVIEWAERVEKRLPKDMIKITFHYLSESERGIEIEFEDKELEKAFSSVIPTDSTE